MHRFVICLASLIMLVKAEDIRDCFEILRFSGKCCLFKPMNEREDAVRECFQASKGPPHHHSCEFETCYGEKMGIISSNGTVDKTSLEIILDADFANYTELLKIVKEKCVNGDFSDYGPPQETCDVGKIANCIRLQTVFNCPTWDDTERCNTAKDKVGECKSLFP